MRFLAIVALVGKCWNEIVEDLKDWFAFGRDIDKEEESPEEEFTYEPVKSAGPSDDSYGYTVAI